MNSWRASQRREMCAPRRAVAQGGKTVEPKWQRRIPERAIGVRSGDAGGAPVCVSGDQLVRRRNWPAMNDSSVRRPSLLRSDDRG